MVKLFGGIILEGLKTFNEERRTRFEKKHYKILQRIQKEERGEYPDYSDANLGLANEEFELFVQAYSEELKANNEAKGIL
jgi:hypothetical protein